MNRLQNKTCVVTGAASGMGWATSCMFAQEGASVVALDIDSEGLARLAQQHARIQTHRVDIVDSAQVAAFAENAGQVDALFNCAGRVAVGSILECSVDDWQRTFDLNVSGMFLLCKALLPRMLAQATGGSIINMASVISSIGGAPDRFAYGASKAAVIGITKSIAKDFAGRNIRCNAICPSAVETPSMSDRIEQMDDPAAARAMFSARQPVGRMGTPEEIAHLATYLASDESRFVTGSAVVIDGGTKL
ncbi:MAG: SDR family oxidoreductase [Gammaproteobacteria bacterium]|nr:SDR family oxidoreductase [Gammaproteobacteria bacterium]